MTGPGGAPGTGPGQDPVSWAGMSVEGFLERMSRSPAPAAGSAAAVAVGMAAALVGKAARRSRRHLDADALARMADALRERALHLAGADAAAVTVMTSSGTGVPPEAVAVPREIGELATEVARLAAQLREHGNPDLLADAVAAQHLAAAAGAATEAILISNVGGSGTP